jgi:putative Mn2+ efflux pump MntP
MGFAELLLLAAGLSMDCFAVALTLSSTQRLQVSDTLKISLTFGLFQGALPVAGWFVGKTLHDYIARYDHWIAFTILAFIGIKMILHSLKKDKDATSPKIISWTLILSLGLATSIDALITGFGLGFTGVNIVLAVLVIGVTTAILTFSGTWLGRRTNFIPPSLAELTGGIVLVGIGIKVLLDHLTG